MEQNIFTTKSIYSVGVARENYLQSSS